MGDGAPVSDWVGDGAPRGGERVARGGVRARKVGRSGARRPQRRGWGKRSGLEVFRSLASGAYTGQTRLGKFMRACLNGTERRAPTVMQEQGSNGRHGGVRSSESPAQGGAAVDSGGSPPQGDGDGTARSAPAPRQAGGRPLCTLAGTVRSSLLRLLSSVAPLRPRAEREAFAGLAILALEFQHSGRQESPSYDMEALSARPTVQQKRALRVLNERSRKFIASIKTVPRVAAASGRCCEKVSRALDEVYSMSTRNVTDNKGRKQTKHNTGPLRVKAARIAIPDKGRTVELGRYMPPRVEACFADPACLSKDEGAPIRVPRARVHASKDDERALLEKMDAAGMLEVELADRVPRGPDGESLACGLFAVAKDPDRDRLITNCIPPNAVEKSLGASRDLFPHASCFCELQLTQNQELAFSAMDLPDFYHTCGVTRARAQRNQVGAPRAQSEVQGLAAFRRLVAREGSLPPDALVSILQATLPMGDKNATDFAQAGHVGLLRAHGGALPEELVTYRAPFPRGEAWQTVMVDDNVIVGLRRRGRRGRKPPTAETRDEALVRQSLAAYASAGVDPKPAKTVLFAKGGTALGAAIDGAAGWVSAKPGHVVLAFATLGAAVEARGATHEAAALGTALLTHVMSMRRDAMCLADRLYTWTHRLSQGNRAFGRMSDAVADEIQTLALLAPLLGTDLRVRSHDELLCTDARGGARPWGGVCRTPISDLIARDLWRLRVRKGGSPCLDDRSLETLKQLRQAFLDAGVPAELVEEALFLDGEDTEEVATTRGWVGDLLKGLDWRRGAFGWALPPKEHVNLSEYRALRVCVRRLIREGTWSSRVLVCTDSNVVIGAVAKGRSRSMRLRRLQQGFVAELLFYNLYLGVLPVASKDNPADDPSRNEAVRKPDPESVPWVARYLRGDLSVIDKRIWAGDRERWLVAPGWTPPPRSPLDEWTIPHAAWKARTAAQRDDAWQTGEVADFRP